MEETKEKVVSWIRSGMDYNEGIDLLVEITGKKSYGSQFTGGHRSMSGKLAYEICRASKVANVITWKKFIQDVKDGFYFYKPVDGDTEQDFEPVPELKPGEELNAKVSVPVSKLGVSSNLVKTFMNNVKKKDSSEPSQEIEHLDENPLTEYPPVIRRIIYDYAEMFQERSKLHTVMASMDGSNAESVMAKRAEMFSVIKALSARLEVLYDAKKLFEKEGVVPKMSEIFPPEDEPEKEDINSLDEESLKTRKKNLQNSNSKDQSFLDYQSPKHGENKNPMPAGPKRIKIEYRMKQRVKQIEEVDTALLKYVIKE